MLYKRKPWLAGLRVAGSLTYVLIKHGIPRKAKFEPRAQVGYLVGMEASNIYRIWIPTTNRIIRSRDVRIDESKRYQSPETPVHLIISQAQKDRFQQVQDLLDNLQDGSKDWMENFDEELDVRLPHLVNIDVTPTSKSIQISTEELRQLPTPELTPEPSIPSASLAPQQTPSTTQSSSEVTEPPFVDPTPRSEPQTTAGSSSGGERRSGREKRSTAKKKDMPNQDLRRRAFAVQINDGDDLIDPETTPLAHAFYTAATKTYGYRDDFPPPPKSWKEMLNHRYAIEFKAAAHTEMKALIGKHTWDEVRLVKKAHRLPTMWVFTYKEDSDGYITRFKARLVVRGDL